MKKAWEFVFINIGLVLVALGIYLFKIPNNFATGGVSGIAIVLSKFFTTAPIGLLMLGINILLMFIGLAVIGFDFGSKTIYSSFALSGFVWFLQQIHPITKPLITTVLNRKQAIKLRSFIREIDKKAFITISNTSEIIGKGFRNNGL